MRKIIAVVAGVACVIPALAFAAQPKPDSQYRYCENQQSCPLSFNTSGTGRKIKNLSMFNRCAELPAPYPKVRVNDEGRFKKSGKVEDVLGNEVRFTFKGRFKRPKKAVGTFELDSTEIRGGKTKECDADPEKFVAKYVPPTPSN
jgi:hypothetical protein